MIRLTTIREGAGRVWFLWLGAWGRLEFRIYDVRRKHSSKDSR